MSAKRVGRITDNQDKSQFVREQSFWKLNQQCSISAQSCRSCETRLMAAPSPERTQGLRREFVIADLHRVARELAHCGLSRPSLRTIRTAPFRK